MLTGISWPLNGIKIPFPGRKKTTHNVTSLASNGMMPPGSHAWDDELDFNTQCSSQWDSLVHMQHQPSGMAYNGLKPTQEGLTSPQSTAENELPTLDHWHSRGGLVGRGVLVDFKGYMESQSTPYHSLDGYRITVHDIEAVARHQGVEFRRGDVLLVRTGITEVWEDPTADDLAKLSKATLSGLDGTEEMARWLWNKHFTAVAGDSQSCEAYPPLRPDGTVGSATELGESGGRWTELKRFPPLWAEQKLTTITVLHQYCLSLFGMPLGELWDLKELSAYCKKTGRYSFMITSAPLNHPGLVGSPPNALAIF